MENQELEAVLVSGLNKATQRLIYFNVNTFL